MLLAGRGGLCNFAPEFLAKRRKHLENEKGETISTRFLRYDDKKILDEAIASGEYHVFGGVGPALRGSAT